MYNEKKTTLFKKLNVSRLFFIRAFINREKTSVFQRPHYEQYLFLHAMFLEYSGESKVRFCYTKIKEVL